MENFFILHILLLSCIGLFTLIDTRHHHHPEKHYSKHRHSHQKPEGRYFTRSSKPQKIQSLEKFQAEALQIHNQLRAKHGSPPLILDQELCQLAMEWAEEIGEGSDALQRIVLSHTPGMKTNGGIGDNIFGKTGNKDVTGEFATNWWYKEIKYMNWSDNQYHWRTGHFTQLIWKGSEKFGIAKLKTPEMGFSIVVATYSPRGNMKYIKAFADNVLPPIDVSSP